MGYQDWLGSHAFKDYTRPRTDRRRDAAASPAMGRTARAGCGGLDGAPGGRQGNRVEDARKLYKGVLGVEDRRVVSPENMEVTAQMEYSQHSHWETYWTT